MQDCPPKAIHRAPNGEVFIRDHCPYGVIQLAPVDPERKAPSLLTCRLFGASGAEA
jgi:hypothetical protein